MQANIHGAANIIKATAALYRTMVSQGTTPLLYFKRAGRLPIHVVDEDSYVIR